MKLNKKYTVYLIQHSHTDIGYTKSPELTINEQLEYLYFLIGKFEEILAGRLPEYQNYKWVCESFIIVERFLKTASSEDIERFIKLVKLGKIEVTGMYANLAEVLDADILEAMIKRAKTAEAKYGIDVSCAMNADINGISRDYGRALSANGIHNYFIAVHTHHGMYPLFKKQQAFKWDLGDGEYLNVWNGEHYMFGNGFAFSKGAISVHGFFDNVDFKKYNTATDDSWIKLAESRFEKYINKLEADGYGYDFIPLTIHGKFTDNSMPNLDIANRVDTWNLVHGEQIEVKMCTLSEFFERLNEETDIPVYSGEWPDWWTDGVISAPAQLKLFKNAQSQYKDLQAIDNENILTAELKDDIDYNLTMYAEHTYGSHDSISNPYHDFTHRQWALKQNYLSNALRSIDEYEHVLLKSKGKITTLATVATEFKVINPSDSKVVRQLQIPFDNSDADNLTGSYRITDNLGRDYEYIVTDDWRQFPIVNISLDPNQELVLNVCPEPARMSDEVPYYSRSNLRGSDNVFDLGFMAQDVEVSSNQLVTPAITMAWNDQGITSIIHDQKELLNKNEGLLSPIYERSSAERHTLGRNRKGPDVIRAFGTLRSTEIITQNKLHTVLKQQYQVAGLDNYTLYIKVANDQPIIEFKINCDKQLSADIENVYLSLPFENPNLILGQSQSSFEPWVDQLPGTLADYFPCYKGFEVPGTLAFATPDTHLIQIGSLDPEPRILYGEERLQKQVKKPYIWLMSNYWETNFVKSLAGFYEFNFRLDLSNEPNPIEAASTELLAFPILNNPQK